MNFTIIVAVDSRDGIAKDKKLPWAGTPEHKEDLRFFRKITCNSPNNAVIMGRGTWESLPVAPLPGRKNIVLSTGAFDVPPEHIDTVYAARSLDDALAICANMGCQNVFVIGGAEVYKQALRDPRLEAVYVTRFDRDYQCDSHVDLSTVRKYGSTQVIGQSGDWGIVVQRYCLYNRWENEYMGLLRRLLAAPLVPNRTGIDAHRLFSESLRFELTDPRGRVLPLLTTRRLAYSAIFYELMWFLRGETDTKYLHQHNVHIWDKNSSREYLDSVGLNHYPEGYLGPIYGYQWRKRGPDQLATVIEGICKDPFGRRHLVCAWNAEDIKDMALPPCHYAFQFFVEADKDGKPSRLNCQVNMRSADIGTGVPFNIASYALLTHMVSLITNIAPGTLVINMCDCHLYSKHDEAARELLGRRPRQFPLLRISSEVQNRASYGALKIDDIAFKYDSPAHFAIENYNPHKRLGFDMVV